MYLKQVLTFVCEVKPAYGSYYIVHFTFLTFSEDEDSQIRQISPSAAIPFYLFLDFWH